MIGDGKTIGTQRIKKYLATFDKADLTTQTPYGVITRPVTVTVDDTEVDMTIIDPFAALWMITCPAFGFLETIISDARPAFSMHVGKELTDGLEKYVFRAELDALVRHFQLIRGDV